MFNKVLGDLGLEQYDRDNQKIYAKYWTCSEVPGGMSVYAWQYTPYNFYAETVKTSAASGRTSNFTEMITRCVWSYKY